MTNKPHNQGENAMLAKKMGRRKLLASAVATATVPAIGAPALAQQRRELVVGTFGGLFEKVLRDSVIPDFERQHNATVKLELGIGTTFIPRIVASPRRAPYDVVYVNDDEAILGEDAGLWLPDQSSRLPSLSRAYESLRPPALPLYGSTIYEFVLVYNPAKMSAPASWGDLWRPGLAVGVPHISNSYGLTFLMIAAQMNGGSETNFGPGFDALKRLQNMKIYRGVTQGFTMFQQGEIDAALFYYHRAVTLIDQGVRVAVARPREGTWGQRTGCQIPRGASNPELAVAWTEATLQTKYQEAFAQQMYSPGNRDTKIEAELAKKHIYGPDAVNAIKSPPWRILNPQRDALLGRWNREFTG
jgi:putative spermidine/putrescine transport system substrate-binding protein